MQFLLQTIILFLLNEMTSTELLTSPKHLGDGIRSWKRKSEVLNLSNERNEKIGHLYRRLLKYEHLSRPRSEIFSILTEGTAHQLPTTCKDKSPYCAYWARIGECLKSPVFMNKYCPKSCQKCRGSTHQVPTTCKDKSPYCAYWARNGECIKLPVFMNKYCPKSCQKCRVPATELPTLQPIIEGPLKCGVRSPTQIVSRILGGNVARPRDWPWQVALKLSNEDKIFCGASLIDKEWVVTAGHCLRRFNASKGECVAPSPQIRAVLGEYDLLDVSGHEVLRDVDKICLHPNYDYRTLDYDIALVHLKTPIVSFNEFVTPICLPRHDSVTPVGTYCWITGFGRMEEGISLSDHLRQAEIPTITREKCQELHPSRVISDRMFCAGYSKGEIDACKGDSGGPFVCEQANGRFYLVGTISWGIGCGRANSPGVYTDMRLFRGWIDEVVRSLRE